MNLLWLICVSLVVVCLCLMYKVELSINHYQSEKSACSPRDLGCNKHGAFYENISVCSWEHSPAVWICTEEHRIMGEIKGTEHLSIWFFTLLPFLCSHDCENGILMATNTGMGILHFNFSCSYRDFETFWRLKISFDFSFFLVLALLKTLSYMQVCYCVLCSITIQILKNLSRFKKTQNPPILKKLEIMIL